MELNTDSTIKLFRTEVKSKTLLCSKVSLENRLSYRAPYAKRHSLHELPDQFYEKTKILQEDLELNNIITLLKIPAKERNSKELQIIARFLEESKLAQLYDGDKSGSENLLKNMLLFFANSLNYEFLPKDEYLFRQGEIGDKFFFVIKGSVRIIKTVETEKKMLPEEYINHLEGLKNDQYLLNKTLVANYRIFNLELKHIEDFKEIKEILQMRLNIEATNNHNEYEKLFEKKGIIEPKEPESSKKEKFKILRKSSLRGVANNLNKYNLDFLNKPLENRLVKVYNYEDLVTMGKGNYFGDLAYETKFRNASVFGDEDTHLGSIGFFEYKHYILKNKQQLELKIVENILNSFFSRYHQVRSFYFNYFDFFTYKESKKGEILMSEDEPLQYIYLIKEGEIEYYYRNTLIRFNNLVRTMSNKFNIKNVIGKHEETIYKGDTKTIKGLNTKKFMKIFISGTDHILGMDEYFFDIPKYFQAKISSPNLKYYTISLNNFKNMVTAEPNLFKLLESSTSNKLKTLIERLIEIKNIHFERLGEKEDTLIKEKELETKNYIRKSFEKRRTYTGNTHFLINNTLQEFPITSPLKTIDKKHENSIREIPTLRNEEIKNKLSSPKIQSKNSRNLMFKSFRTEENKIKKSQQHDSMMEFSPSKRKIRNNHPKTNLQLYSFALSKNNVGINMIINGEYLNQNKHKYSQKTIVSNNLNEDIKNLSQEQGYTKFNQISGKFVPPKKFTDIFIKNIKIPSNKKLKQLIELNNQCN